MIRFLQKDSRTVKAIFIVIISVACITMVITLVPGIFSDSTSSSDTYATIRGAGFFGRIFGSTDDVTTQEVQQLAQRMMQRQQLPDFVLPFMMQRVGQGLIQQHIELQEAGRLGVNVTDEDLRAFLRTGTWGQVLFPNGHYVGDEQYASLVSQNFGISREMFEKELKKELQENRLRSFVTAGVTVSDQQVRDSYVQQATKIKFDYAVVSADDLRKTINPTDTELQAFFKQNTTRYAKAIPETRKIEYVAFTTANLPGGAPQVTDAEVQQYYNQHQSDYKVEDQVKVRHILIKVDPNADAKADAAAKEKAEDILKQLHNGGNFADLAKKNSDDPGSKEQGGELGFIKHGVTVPEFDKAAFALQPGQTSDLVRTKFGYHIIQTEEKQTAHTRSLDEVKPTIVAVLTRQKEAQAQQAFAQQLASEAQKSGMAQTAAAHHLQVVTTDYLAQNAIIPTLADGSQMLTSAFSAKQGAAPAVASTGDGFAIFEVQDVHAAHAPTFDEYKSHILDDFRDDQLPQLLTRKTNELADKAKAENDLAKAAKEVGATMKSSDLVGRDAQVPDVGQLSSTAPTLFDLNVGQISQPINSQRTGVVAKLTEKQQPTPDEIQKNFEQTRDALLNQRREDMFSVFVTNLTDQYQKEGRIRVNKRMQQQPGLPGAPQS
ncbi:peptidyl-prolyl cis-trans isomerase [Alloacidobacterium dinghuense]|uniref:Periplasmic chaperone PpiD n=1 Tax=Alloacidobacterium dinghuense TaxID=2763107 RepID=A0A7G8BP66_9BACT|nr:peptidyl-prolyl cis-trans isomerase [Alloacidobacterium dinghuense]QNI34336.1 peptidyl-prolyl cis-trans isomerase [Alloacidobacterium dinghuense]